MKSLHPPVLLFLLVFPAFLSAQTPVGGPIQVAVASPGKLQGEAVAMSPRGDFVVGWTRLRPDNIPVGVFFRLYAADGKPKTSEIRINKNPSDRSFAVRLAMMADGSFVAVFPTQSALLARRFTAGGTPVGGNLVVTRDPVSGFEVGSRGDGGFVVTWVGGFPGVAVRAFGVDGQPLGPQVQAVDAPVGGPRLAVLPDGAFLVVWLQVETSSTPAGHDYAIQGRLFNPDGSPRTGSLLISTTLSEDLFSFAGYDTAVDAAGNLLVTWFQVESAPAPPSAYVRRYSPAGVSLAGPSLAGHRPAGQEIAADPDGGFVSSWETSLGPTADVVVRRLASSGAPAGPLVVLGRATFAFPSSPPLAGNGTGSFVVAWPDNARRGGGTALFVRRFRAD